MGELTKWLGLLTFVGMGGVSGYFFNQYATAPLIKDVGLVTQSAKKFGETLDAIDKQGDSYITTDSSTLPLTYALERMDVVRQGNPDNIEDIDKLIEEINSIRGNKEILADPVLYRTAISGLENDLSDYAATNKDGVNIYMGCVGAIGSLLGASIIYQDRHNFG